MSSTDAAARAPLGTLSMRRVLAFFFMVVGMFMAILDIQIVASSITKIQAGLSASTDEISWVQTSYLIAEVIMIPMSGWLSRVMSTRYLFVASSLGFTFMSLMCATATSIDQMIVYRALQGFLGGAMIPTVFATAYGDVFPPHRRHSIGLIIGLVVTLAPTIGPTLGGFLTDALSWHWLFLVNIVPGLIVSAAAWSLIDFDDPDWSLLKGFDGWGIALMATFLGSLEYVLEEGPRNDWLNDNVIWWMTVTCAISASFFFVRVLTFERPIVELRSYRNRNFAVGSLMSLFHGVAIYGLTYLFPLFLAEVRHLTALQIGQVMAVTGLTQFLITPIAGRLSRSVDIRILLAFGFSMLALSNFMMLDLTWEWDFGQFLVPQIIRGIGLMFCIVSINNLALGTLQPEELKNASGLYNLMRNLGGALGLAVINTVLIHRSDFHKSRLREAIEQGRPVVEGTLKGLDHQLSTTLGSLGDMGALKEIYRLVTREATVMAFADCFFLLSICFVAILFTLPLVNKPQANLSPEDAH